MLLDANFELINEEFFADAVTGDELDLLLDDGWRHFGQHFFRYNLGVYDNEIRLVLPLRIRLADFRLSKSQRRVHRRNADVEVHDSVAGLRRVIADPIAYPSGSFLDYRGQSLAW